MTAPALNPDEVSRVLMLVYGTMQHGGPYWCYVAVKPSRFYAFQQAQKSKTLDIHTFEPDYGEVIVSGEGVLPPQDVTAKVARMYSLEIKDFFKQMNDPVGVIVQKIQDAAQG